MARIRTIKPEFWSSPGLPDDPWVRLVFIAMWNWADDYGIGVANERELLGFVFPNDDQIGSADLRRMLASVHRAFGVKFYTVAGRPYYAIPSWESHQKIDRRSARRNPGPDEAETWLYQDPPESPRVPAESPPSSQRDAGVGKGTEDLGKGTEEVGTEEAAQPENAPAPPDPESSPEAARKRGRRLPENWRPSETTTEWAKSKFGHLNLELEFEKFVNHWTAASGQNSRKCDWDAALRNWLHNARPSPHAMATNGHATSTAFQRKTAHNAAVFESLGDQPNRPELMP